MSYRQDYHLDLEGISPKKPDNAVFNQPLDILVTFTSMSETINGRPAPQGFRLAPTSDFFADRSMWGLSHVIRIPDVK